MAFFTRLQNYVNASLLTLSLGFLTAPATPKTEAFGNHFSSDLPLKKKAERPRLSALTAEVLPDHMGYTLDFTTLNAQHPLTLTETSVPIVLAIDATDTHVTKRPGKDGPYAHPVVITVEKENPVLHYHEDGGVSLRVDGKTVLHAPKDVPLFLKSADISHSLAVTASAKLIQVPQPHFDSPPEGSGFHTFLKPLGKANTFLHQVTQDYNAKALAANFKIMKEAGCESDCVGFLKKTGKRESGLTPFCVNEFGYAGIWQFGDTALEHVGLKDAHGNWKGVVVDGMAIDSQEDFLANFAAQTQAMMQLLQSNAKAVRQFIRTVPGGSWDPETGYISYLKSDGSTVSCSLISAATACHLVGIGTVQRMIESGQDPSEHADAYATTAAAYIRVGQGFDFTIDKNLRVLEDLSGKGTRMIAETTQGVVPLASEPEPELPENMPPKQPALMPRQRQPLREKPGHAADGSPPPKNPKDFALNPQLKEQLHKVATGMTEVNGATAVATGKDIVKTATKPLELS